MPSGLSVDIENEFRVLGQEAELLTEALQGLQDREFHETAAQRWIETGAPLDREACRWRTHRQGRCLACDAPESNGERLSWSAPSRSIGRLQIDAGSISKLSAPGAKQLRHQP